MRGNPRRGTHQKSSQPTVTGTLYLESMDSSSFVLSIQLDSLCISHHDQIVRLLPVTRSLDRTCFPHTSGPRPAITNNFSQHGLVVNFVPDDFPTIAPSFFLDFLIWVLTTILPTQWQ